MNKKPKILNYACNYDEKYDILYISVIPNKPAIAEENDGLIVRYDIKQHIPIGITIFDFKKTEIYEFIKKL